MRRFFRWLASLPLQALAYLFESFNDSPPRERLADANKPRRVRTVSVSPPKKISLPFSKSKYDLERLEAARVRRAKRNAKRAAQNYRPAAPKPELENV